MTNNLDNIKKAMCLLDGLTVKGIADADRLVSAYKLLRAAQEDTEKIVEEWRELKAASDTEGAC
jgi:hypothetical protein